MPLIFYSLRRSTRVLASLAGSAFFLHAPLDARAETLTDPTPVSGWIVTVRANAGYAANYDGSSGVSPYALPGLEMRPPNTPVSFSAPDKSPGFALYDAQHLGLLEMLIEEMQVIEMPTLFVLHQMVW